MTLTVYFPQQMLKCESGLLYGHFNNETNSYYVTNLCENHKQNDLNNKIIGFFSTASTSNSHKFIKHFDDLNYGIALHKIKETIYVTPTKQFNKPTALQNCSLILYDFDGIANSVNYNSWYLNKKTFEIPSKKENQKITNTNKPNEKHEKKYSNSKSVYTLFDLIFQHKNNVKTPKSQNIQKWDNFWIQTMWFLFPLIKFCLTILENLGTYSSFGARLCLKLKMLFNIQSHESKINYKNGISCMLIDSLLGYLVYVWITNNFGTEFMDYIWKVMLPFVKYIGKEVNLLIDWLMGIPIGLKLNHQLNQFLGKFFLHHVKLWLEYIKFLLDLPIPKYLNLLWPMLFYSGLSTFLALLSDATSLLTFHVYCFYVYAARVYGLQVTGLVSFWRLFIGRKWNPLRQRVDTLTQPHDTSGQRFFVGTLVFTILLFLLPTTALYYGIFAILRVGIIAIQKSLLLIQHLLCYFPWYILYTRFQYSLAFPTKASLEMVNESEKDKSMTSDGYAWIKAEQMSLTFDVQSYMSIIMFHLFGNHLELFGKLNVKEILFSMFSGKLLKWV